MILLCHRCHGELPFAPAAGGQEPDAMLFCPHCSAPQIRLPEHMLPQSAVAPAETAGASAESVTTGHQPPPNPHGIDWPVALRSAAVVALGAAFLSVLGFFSAFLSHLETFWVLGCAFLAVGLYRRSRPQAWLDARAGLRIGLVSGLLVFAAMAVSLAAAGVLARFGLHRMGAFDGELATNFAAMQASLTQKLAEQGQGKEAQQHLAGLIGSPEVRGGLTLLYLGFSGCMILLFAAAGGALAGMLQQRRQVVNQG